MKTIFFTLLFSIMSVVPAQAQDKDQDFNAYLDVDVEKLSDSNINFQVWKLMRPGGYQKAIDFCDKVLRHKPHNGEAHFGKGRVLAELDKDKEALKSYDLAIKYKYKFIGELYYHRGISLERLGRYEKAVENYELAIKNGFTDSYVYHTRNNLMMRLGTL